MNLSFGEFRALVAKSMRGVGYSWGLTEDGSFAAKRLAEFGVSSGDMVVRLLQEVDGSLPTSFMPDKSWVSASGLVCPISLGTTLADSGGCDDLTVHNVLEPLLLVPALSESCHEGNGYVMSWAEGECYLDRETFAVQGFPSTGAVEISLRSTSALSHESRPRSPRVILDATVADQLATFAHRVYAPATDESRSGAGAGLTDND